jgi:hypothetical protein
MKNGGSGRSGQASFAFSVRELCMELVLTERIFAEPVDLSELREAMKKNGSCLDLHDVRYLQSYLSTDRLRMVCLFEAPDAESVRIANRKANMPFERIWTATIHEPSK